MGYYEDAFFPLNEILFEEHTIVELGELAIILSERIAVSLIQITYIIPELMNINSLTLSLTGAKAIANNFPENTKNNLLKYIRMEDLHINTYGNDFISFLFKLFQPGFEYEQKYTLGIVKFIINELIIPATMAAILPGLVSPKTLWIVEMLYKILDGWLSGGIDGMITSFLFGGAGQIGKSKFGKKMASKVKNIFPKFGKKTGTVAAKTIKQGTSKLTKLIRQFKNILNVIKKSIIMFRNGMKSYIKPSKTINILKDAFTVRLVRKITFGGIKKGGEVILRKEDIIGFEMELSQIYNVSEEIDDITTDIETKMVMKEGVGYVKMNGIEFFEFIKDVIYEEEDILDYIFISTQSEFSNFISNELIDTIYETTKMSLRYDYKHIKLFFSKFIIKNIYNKSDLINIIGEYYNNYENDIEIFVNINNGNELTEYSKNLIIEFFELYKLLILEDLMSRLVDDDGNPLDENVSKVETSKMIYINKLLSTCVHELFYNNAILRYIINDIYLVTNEVGQILYELNLNKLTYNKIFGIDSRYNTSELINYNKYYDTRLNDVTFVGSYFGEQTSFNETIFNNSYFNSCSFYSVNFDMCSFINCNFKYAMFLNPFRLPVPQVLMDLYPAYLPNTRYVAFKEIWDENEVLILDGSGNNEIIKPFVNSKINVSSYTGTTINSRLTNAAEDFNNKSNVITSSYLNIEPGIAEMLFSFHSESYKFEDKSINDFLHLIQWYYIKTLKGAPINKTDFDLSNPTNGLDKLTVTKNNLFQTPSIYELMGLGITPTDIVECDFAFSDFEEAVFQDHTFINCNFSFCNFRNATFINTKFINCNLHATIFNKKYSILELRIKELDLTKLDYEQSFFLKNNNLNCIFVYNDIQDTITKEIMLNLKPTNSSYDFKNFHEDFTIFKSDDEYHIGEDNKFHMEYTKNNKYYSGFKSLSCLQINYILFDKNDLFGNGTLNKINKYTIAPKYLPFDSDAGLIDIPYKRIEFDLEDYASTYKVFYKEYIKLIRNNFNFNVFTMKTTKDVRSENIDKPVPDLYGFTETGMFFHFIRTIPYPDFYDNNVWLKDGIENYKFTNFPLGTNSKNIKGVDGYTDDDKINIRIPHKTKGFEDVLHKTYTSKLDGNGYLERNKLIDNFINIQTVERVGITKRLLYFTKNVLVPFIHKAVKPKRKLESKYNEDKDSVIYYYEYSAIQDFTNLAIYENFSYILSTISLEKIKKISYKIKPYTIPYTNRGIGQDIANSVLAYNSLNKEKLDHLTEHFIENYIYNAFYYGYKESPVYNKIPDNKETIIYPLINGTKFSLCSKMTNQQLITYFKDKKIYYEDGKSIYLNGRKESEEFIDGIVELYSKPEYMNLPLLETIFSNKIFENIIIKTFNLYDSNKTVNENIRTWLDYLDFFSDNPKLDVNGMIKCVFDKNTTFKNIIFQQYSIVDDNNFNNCEFNECEINYFIGKNKFENCTFINCSINSTLFKTNTFIKCDIKENTKILE